MSKLMYEHEKMEQALIKEFYEQMPGDSQKDPYTIRDFVKWLIISKKYIDRFKLHDLVLKYERENKF